MKTNRTEILLRTMCYSVAEIYILFKLTRYETWFNLSDISKGPFTLSVSTNAVMLLPISL